MAAIKIVTDSSCDIPPPLLKEFGIVVVPMNIHFGSETYQEGVSMSATEFYTRLVRDGTSVLPKTSQPSPGAFREAFVAAAQDCRDIIAIHVSSAFSGTYNAALSVAREMNDAREAHITVIDSRNASMCLGWTVLAAAEAARRNETYADVVNLVLDMIPRLHIPSMLETLEYVRAGGRIGKATAFLGTLLNVKPILGIEGGEVVPIEKVRTKARALERLIDITRQYAPFEDVAVMHTNEPEVAADIVNLLAPYHPRDEILTAQTCAAIGAHVGPGAIGVCLVSQK